MKWPPKRLDEILAKAPCQVKCDTPKAAANLRFALYNRIRTTKGKPLALSVTKTTVHIEQYPEFVLLTTESDFPDATKQ